MSHIHSVSLDDWHERKFKEHKLSLSKATSLGIRSLLTDVDDERNVIIEETEKTRLLRFEHALLTVNDVLKQRNDQIERLEHELVEIRKEKSNRNAKELAQRH